MKKLIAIGIMVFFAGTMIAQNDPLPGSQSNKQTDKGKGDKHHHPHHHDHKSADKK